MKLSALTSQYVAYKQAMGMRFHTEACTLQSFCRIMGDIAVAEIAADRVHAYIAGAGPVTRFWHRKYEVLRGFYRYQWHGDTPPVLRYPRSFPNHCSLSPTSSRTRNCSDCSTPAPIAKTRGASCSLTLAACLSCCCMERHCASVRRFPSRWSMWIYPPASSRFAKANSTRHGWYPWTRLSPARWGTMWPSTPRSTPLN